VIFNPYTQRSTHCHKPIKGICQRTGKLQRRVVALRGGTGMKTCTETTPTPQLLDKKTKNDAGYHNLAEYCQSLFEIEENFNHHNTDEYQNVKRQFVKYLTNIKTI
jgi:hypothetical protein